MLLAKFDVQGSIAHVTMLGENGMMSIEESDKAVAELKNILQEIEIGNFSIDEGAEDIHSQVEFMLTERIGDTGKMIHSGRSRNDQVAVDIKLFLRSIIYDVKEDVLGLFDTKKFDEALRQTPIFPTPTTPDGAPTYNPNSA
jgi:argininosuccinate lyase